MLERIGSSEEKIRRAEEIYYRRRNQNRNRNIATVNVNNEKNYGLLKKLILQVLICLVIYFIFYIIQNSNYIFSEDVIYKTKEVLSYDINIPEAFQQIMQYINQAGEIKKEEESNTQEETQDQTEQTPSKEEQPAPTEALPQEENTQQEATGNETHNTSNNEISKEGENTESNNTTAIGGADFEDVVMEDTIPKTQDELDIEYLKTFSWTKPVLGTVTSEFGKRESNNPIVGSNHTGIDIGANTGTVVVAAISGKVTIASTVGEYGHHIKITNNDISTLYAHCSKLYVKEGDEIQQGQAIAEVGSTGKSTGPHLHFEVIRENRYINPRNVLEF